MSALILTALLAAGPADMASLDWLGGCWVQTRGETRIEELWTSPAGGILLGSGRTTKAGSLRSYEQMRIEVIDGTPTFIALPSGQAEGRFPLKFAADDEWVFENTAHDFPQRVIYSRGETGRLNAAIEGTIKGQTKRIEFAYEACPAP
ncbi:DUF6265 family protein [Asticcacaulis sp. AND118]|uniref:DUF6265 family protein n=1 Tax=Asticcacaulis sp. AND118 TaxID=2840468 RepID=UPI001CFF554E|nr:DUF6265 family protein [Asticcacaulis sp. AND118]UDF02573.1 DUF6265 family protein [Asticcacaulis sp. AND118]